MTETCKSPITRLLDLTLGWAEYVDSTEDKYPDCVSLEKIFGLYQGIAGFTEAEWDGTYETQAAAVRRYVEEYLMPVLLRKDSD